MGGNGIAGQSGLSAGRAEQAHKAVARLRQLNPTLRVSTLKDVLGPFRRAETGNFAILGPQKPISLHETTVLQRFFTKFPTQINRENILKNREISGKNREIW